MLMLRVKIFMVSFQNILGAQTWSFAVGDKSDVDATSASALWDCPTQEMFFSTKEQYRQRAILIVQVGPREQNHHYWVSRLKTQSKNLIQVLRLTPAELCCEPICDCLPRNNVAPVWKHERVCTLDFVLCMFSFAIQLLILSHFLYCSHHKLHA